MGYLNEALSLLEGDSQHERGRNFERLMRVALERHPGEYGSLRFRKVWMWDDCPHTEGQDAGIDLVAEEHSGKLCAIQCKFFAPDATLDKPGLDSFVTKSATDQYSSRILIFTGGGYNKNASKVVEQTTQPNIEVITRDDLASWPIDDWRDFVNDPDSLEFAQPPPVVPRSYQVEAIEAIMAGFGEDDKGKLIAPCGTGKTAIHLWVAEEMAKRQQGAIVLYVMPSLMLVGQTIRNWAANRERCDCEPPFILCCCDKVPIHHSYFAVCSDKSVGKKTDGSGGGLDELPLPATTDPNGVAEWLTSQQGSGSLSALFATYQSLKVVAEAQRRADVEFDLVICDEAHRTTGIEKGDSAEASGFRLIHEQGAILRKKVLFSTATPKIWTEDAKATIQNAALRKQALLAAAVSGGVAGEGLSAEDKAALLNAEIGVYSMDDPDYYGEEFYRLSFAKAIHSGWLAEYRVLAIGVDESDPVIQRALNEIDESKNDADAKEAEMRHGEYKMKVADFVRLLGCWDALADPLTAGTKERAERQTVVGTINPANRPAQRAIAFTNAVKDSKAIGGIMNAAISAIPKLLEDDPAAADLLNLQVRHIDGTMTALRRQRDVGWLGGGDIQDNEARLLSNARCLTEGVDVPDLDAVVFVAPRQSVVEIVQAVGRVMRQPSGKDNKIGYIVLPILVPEGKTLEDMLAEKNPEFQQVWRVLNALKAHDERLAAWVDTADITKRDADFTPLSVVFPKTGLADRDTDGITEYATDQHAIDGIQLSLEFADAIASQIVLSCGNRQWYPTWGKIAANILTEVEAKLNQHIDRNGAQFEKHLEECAAAFGRADLTADELIHTLAQHIITYPVFEVLFGDVDFNPIGDGFNKIITETDPALPDECAALIEPLSMFYAGVKERHAIANTPEAQKRMVIEIYENFFAEATPDTQASLGIAYTPTWIVDFMLKSSEEILRDEFGVGITSKKVHVLDPFTGTGTFVNRLIAGKTDEGKHLIRKQDLQRKYTRELHATEILPLAFHIAQHQITLGYKERDPESDNPFEGVVLADTYAMTQERAQSLFEYRTELEENSNRRARQKRQRITLMVTNPPWSLGKKKAGDKSSKPENEAMAERVHETYNQKYKEISGKAPSGRSSGNLFIQAFRWATDRLLHDNHKSGDSKPTSAHSASAVIDSPTAGVIAFVHPNSLTVAGSMAGVRGTMRDEFSKIYVINLRGDAYTSAEAWKREGHNPFGGSTRQGVQITFLVSAPSHNPPCESLDCCAKPAEVFYLEVPDGLNLDDKKDWLAQVGGVISGKHRFTEIPVTPKHRWTNLPSEGWDDLLPVMPESKKESAPQTIFANYESGVTTGMDDLVYSVSRARLEVKARSLIDEYEDVRSQLHPNGEKRNVSDAQLAAYIETPDVDQNPIVWGDKLKSSLKQNKPLMFDENKIIKCLYRPFVSLWLYADFDICAGGRAGAEPYVAVNQSSTSSDTHTHTHCCCDPTSTPNRTADSQPTELATRTPLAGGQEQPRSAETANSSADGTTSSTNQKSGAGNSSATPVGDDGRRRDDTPDLENRGGGSGSAVSGRHNSLSVDRTTQTSAERTAAEVCAVDRDTSSADNGADGSANERGARQGRVRGEHSGAGVDDLENRGGVLLFSVPNLRLRETQTLATRTAHDTQAIPTGGGTISVC